MILPQTAILGLFCSLRVTRLQVRGCVFYLAKPSVYWRKGQRRAHPESTFVQLTVSAVEFPKVTQISISEP